jgi:hypothetical protein
MDVDIKGLRSKLKCYGMNALQGKFHYLTFRQSVSDKENRIREVDTFPGI